MDKLHVGLVGEAQTEVTESLSATHLGSGAVSVYATPAMIALMEMAAVNAIEALLETGQSSVGTLVNIRHLAATPLHRTVRARAEVTAVEGRSVTFKVVAWDDTEQIGEGTHTRFIIDVARFQARLAAK
jgi:predicted thioesterase